MSIDGATARSFAVGRRGPKAPRLAPEVCPVHDALTVERTKLIETFRDLAVEITEQDLPHFDEASPIASLGVDSLQYLEIIGELERELDIEIPSEALEGLETVSMLLDLVEKRLADAPAP
ncbi:MAG: acyl carrier protein [Myxococcota bacterium]